MNKANELPRIYCGVWRRTLLEGEGLATDTSSTVLWLQTPLWHGDLRLPAARPHIAGLERFADCTSTDIRKLAQQQGFSGLTQVEGDVCEWLRDVDFQPRQAARDVGRMVFLEDGRVLEEYGVEADYHETWQRVPDGNGPCACWERGGTGARKERLLVAGDCFFLVRDRETPLPAADGRYPTLSELVFERPHMAVSWLNLTLAYGRVRGGAKPWCIEHASLPWLEGRSLNDLGLGPLETWTERLWEAGAPTSPFNRG